MTKGRMMAIAARFKRSFLWLRQETSLLGGPALVVMIGVSISALGSERQTTVIGALISALGALWANYARNRGSTKLAEKNEEIVRLNKEIVNTITGGTSFAHLVPYGGVGPNAMVCCEGAYPLYEVSVRVTDLEIFETMRKASVPNYQAADIVSFSVGEMPPKTAQMLPMPVFLLHGTQRCWNIFFMARNGPATQRLRMRLVNGKWESATRVLRADGSTVAYEEISEHYPREPDGTVAWE